MIKNNVYFLYTKIKIQTIRINSFCNNLNHLLKYLMKNYMVVNYKFIFEFVQKAKTMYLGLKSLIS